MPARCPPCGQMLPSAIDEQTLQGKLEKLTSVATKAAAEAERQRLKEEFEDKLTAERLFRGSCGTNRKRLISS